MFKSLHTPHLLYLSTRHTARSLLSSRLALVYARSDLNTTALVRRVRDASALTRRMHTMNSVTNSKAALRPVDSNNTHLSNPLLDGFHMPAEWEAHERTWMLWPTRPDTWKASAGPAQTAFAAVAKAIARFEPVTVGVPPGKEESARTLLHCAGVTIVVIEQDDAWIRDTGPTFVVGCTSCSGKSESQNARQNIRGVDWSFNAWGGELGGCFSSWNKDDAIASTVLGHVASARYKANMVLEGGSVHVDGEGTVITTEECLLNPNRNPTLDKSDIEKYLRDYLGVELVLWLGQGVVGDVDTDGHIDNLVAFVRPGEVVLHWTDDVADPQYVVSSDALRRLEGFEDARGRRLKVHKCPLPGPIYTTKEDVSSLELKPGSRERGHGERLAASYVNFYLANGAVILPGYGVPEDEAAVRLFKALFPGREVVQVSTLDIALGGGNIHCVTQQQPLGGATSHSV